MKNKYFIILGFIIVLILVGSLIPITKAQKLDKQCEKFGKSYISKEENDNFTEAERSFFYSKRLDTCLMTEVDELGIDFLILDIKQNFLKDIKLVFQCDRSGVDNLILDKAEKYNGELFTVDFEEFLDDGQGGLPRTLKTPEMPYSRDKCRYMFEKKLKELQ